MKNVFVITGAPGGGKTSIISELESRGFRCLQEESRMLIKELLDSGSRALPWIDMLAFNRLLLERQVRQYLCAPDGEACFFDRSFVDNLGYLKHSYIPVPEEFSEVIGKYRFNRTVFFTEPWKEIYVTDSERKEPFDMAERLSALMKNAYIASGYEPVAVPRLSVPERVDFVLEKIGLE